ncbi:polyphenol oxidase family protein [Glutamicibacter sp.]|uniref:polyphenol oxidase family protein n=1 Tax=Glutamicibacter sp. TaxID=1931995 RepID=UPI0028BF3556|nr:polyphenol oxidase family protein [Glutamicibacter sp.]
MLHFASNLDPRIQLAFTTQAEGNLALHVNDDPETVGENRARLEDSIGVRRFSLHFMNQIHSTVVHPAERVERSSWATPAAPTCDALVDASGEQALAVMVADCLPVLFVGLSEETQQTVTAVAHAGRRGLLDGILTRTVEQLRGFGASKIEAVIGPAICGHCYEVPQAMAEESELMRPGIRSLTTWGTDSLDLPVSAQQELENLGVWVRQSNICTLEDERFFSYRRSEKSGRLAGLVWADSRPGATRRPEKSE